MPGSDSRRKNIGLDKQHLLQNRLSGLYGSISLKEISMNLPCLIMLGGAPGVGKSTVASLLNERLDNSIWLDGDDLWRMNPFAVTESAKNMVLRNIRLVLGSFLSETFDYVIFSWVMHDPATVTRILSDLDPGRFRLIHRTLSCSEDTLLRRIAGQNRERDPRLCLNRLRAARQGFPELLETDGLSAGQVAELIMGIIDSRNGAAK